MAVTPATSVERAQLLRQAVKDLGGVPDVVGATLSKAGAFLQTQVNQVQTLQGALLGDLALEQQLPDQEPSAAFHTLSGDSAIRHVAEVDDLQELRETLATSRRTRPARASSRPSRPGSRS